MRVYPCFSVDSFFLLDFSRCRIFRTDGAK